MTTARPGNQSFDDTESPSPVVPVWAQFDLLVANLRDGVTVQDETGRLVYANAAGARLSGYATSAELIEAPIGDYLKKFEVLDALGAPLSLTELPGRKALQSGRATDGLLRVRERATQIERWSEVRSFVVRDPREQSTFVVNVFRDVTESVLQQQRLEDQTLELEEQTAQAQALAEELEQANDELSQALRMVEDDRRREEYLSEATALLAASVDYTAALDRVASLVVPGLADWCGVALRDEESGTVRQLAVAYADPGKAQWARELQERFPSRMDTPRGLPAVLRTGEAELYPVVPDEILVESARNEEELAVLRDLGLRSVMIVPVRANERTVGAISFVAAESGKRYSESDLIFATELGRRAGITIERAQSHREALIARQDAERHSAWLTRLQQLTVALSRALRPVDAVTIALNAGATSFDADRASLWEVERRNAAILLMGQVGYTDDIQSRHASIPLDSPFPQTECARTGLPVIIGDQSAIESRYPEIVATIRAVNAHALALFPIRVGGAVIGVLSYSYSQAREFSEDFITAGRTFAKELGQALDRTQAHSALEVARQSADAANHAKSAFLATMSHELRTPINAILGFTDLLRFGLASGESVSESDYLTRIRRNTEHLLELVNDVLDWAKVEAGQLVIDADHVVSADVVGDAIAVVREQAAARGLSLSAACTVGATYVGDPRRVRQILLNLLSNAVKFTASGGEVTLRCIVRGATTVFTVEDTGIGIAADELGRIFEPFVQAEVGYTRAHGGTGLGLSISRRLARMMGGDVTVESELGTGSRFVLTLPSSPSRTPTS